MGEIRTFLILLCCCRVLSLLTSVVIMKLVVLILLCGLACHHVDAEVETLDIPTDQEGPLVIDPDVAEQMAKDREEELKDAQADHKTETDEKPKVEVLYVPKNCKRKSAKGDLLVVHYTGWLAKSGKKFDTTVDVRRRYAPFEFVVGTGYVIKGWDIGLMDMCPGEKRRLTVPSSLGYGKKGLRGVIPANSTLIFLIDLIDIRHAAPNYAPMDLFTSLDKNNDKILSRDEVSHYVDYQHRMYKKKNAPKMTPEEHEKMIDEIMQKEDKNGDGVIQHSEFSGPKMHVEL